MSQILPRVLRIRRCCNYYDGDDVRVHDRNRDDCVHGGDNHRDDDDNRHDDDDNRRGDDDGSHRDDDQPLYIP